MRIAAKSAAMKLRRATIPSFWFAVMAAALAAATVAPLAILADRI
jgi:hypothetical protein